MRLALTCPVRQSYDYSRFKSGEYEAIVVGGTKKLQDSSHDINLGDLVDVSNGHSSDVLTFKVSQLMKYTAAYTFESALSDFRTRAAMNGFRYDTAGLYLAPNGNAGLMPFLREGIYVIMIKEYKPKTGRGGEGGKKRRRARHTDS